MSDRDKNNNEVSKFLEECDSLFRQGNYQELIVLINENKEMWESSFDLKLLMLYAIAMLTKSNAYEYCLYDKFEAILHDLDLIKSYGEFDLDYIYIKALCHFYTNDYVKALELFSNVLKIKQGLDYEILCDKYLYMSDTKDYIESCYLRLSFFHNKSFVSTIDTIVSQLDALKHELISIVDSDEFNDDLDKQNHFCTSIQLNEELFNLSSSASIDDEDDDTYDEIHIDDFASSKDDEEMREFHKQIETILKNLDAHNYEHDQGYDKKELKKSDESLINQNNIIDYTKQSKVSKESKKDFENITTIVLDNAQQKALQKKKIDFCNKIYDVFNSNLVDASCRVAFYKKKFRIEITPIANLRDLSIIDFLVRNIPKSLHNYYEICTGEVDLHNLYIAINDVKIYKEDLKVAVLAYNNNLNQIKLGIYVEKLEKRFKHFSDKTIGFLSNTIANALRNLVFYYIKEADFVPLVESIYYVKPEPHLVDDFVDLKDLKDEILKNKLIISDDLEFIRRSHLEDYDADAIKSDFAFTKEDVNTKSIKDDLLVEKTIDFDLLYTYYTEEYRDLNSLYQMSCPPYTLAFYFDRALIKERDFDNVDRVYKYEKYVNGFCDSLSLVISSSSSIFSIQSSLNTIFVDLILFDKETCIETIAEFIKRKSKDILYVTLNPFVLKAYPEIIYTNKEKIHKYYSKSNMYLTKEFVDKYLDNIKSSFTKDERAPLSHLLFKQNYDAILAFYNKEESAYHIDSFKDKVEKAKLEIQEIYEPFLDFATLCARQLRYIRDFYQLDKLKEDLKKARDLEFYCQHNPLYYYILSITNLNVAFADNALLAIDKALSFDDDLCLQVQKIKCLYALNRRDEALDLALKLDLKHKSFRDLVQALKDNVDYIEYVLLDRNFISDNLIRLSVRNKYLYKIKNNISIKEFDNDILYFASLGSNKENLDYFYSLFKIDEHKKDYRQEVDYTSIYINDVNNNKVCILFCMNENLISKLDREFIKLVHDLAFDLNAVFKKHKLTIDTDDVVLGLSVTTKHCIHIMLKDKAGEQVRGYFFDSSLKSIDAEEVQDSLKSFKMELLVELIPMFSDVIKQIKQKREQDPNAMTPTSC